MAQLWFKFWAKEYLADTKVRRLSYEQRGILQALWCFAWEEGSIPANQDDLGNMLGIHAKAMRTHYEWISRFFVPMEGDASKLVSPRLEMDRVEADLKGSKARESALQRWSKYHANADANASETQVPSQCVTPCVTDAGQGQGKDNKPLPLSGQGSRKGPRLQELGDYPGELEEAHALWRALLNELKDEEIQSLFPPEKRFLASQVGTREKSWKAWEKHLSKTVQGIRVTNADVLEAVKLWAHTKRKRARSGEALNCPMFPSLLNNADFVDAVVAAMKQRIGEVSHAS